MGEKPFIFEWRFKSIMGLLSGCEWSVHHIMMEEVGAPLMAGHPPFGCCSLLLLYKMGVAPLP
jgi:hypothetical protein